MKKIILSIVLAAMMAGFFIIAQIPLKGAYVDAYFSNKLSKSLAVRVQGCEIVLRRWRQISFESIWIGKSAGNDWIVAKDGILRWSGDRRWLSAKSAQLTPSALKDAPFIGSVLSGGSDSSRSIRDLKIFWYRNASGSTVRISGFESDDFRLKGGLKLDPGDRPVKVHALLLVAPELWHKLPEDLSKRFFKRAGDFRGLRFTWVDQFIRVDGSTGPLLVAGWQKPS